MSRTWSSAGSDAEGLFLSSASDPGSVHRLRKHGILSLEELHVRGEQLYKAGASESDNCMSDGIEVVEGSSGSGKRDMQTSISEKVLEDMPKYSSDSGKSKQETTTSKADPTQAKVEHFYILDENNDAVCMSSLLFDTEMEEAPREYMLRGTRDSGLLPEAKPITSWKACFGKTLTIFVKHLHGNWIQLGKPHKSYELDTARKFFILLNLVNFVKRHLDASRKAVWDHVRSYAEKEPREDDVLDLLHILKKLVAQDSQLAESPVIENILRKRKAHAEPNSNKRLRTRVDESESADRRRSSNAPDDESKSEGRSRKSSRALVDEPKLSLKAPGDESEGEDEDNELGESICAICDDGGNLLCCDGPCLRSFHATASPESSCESLNMTESELEQTFFCKNCARNIHQCFSCGELGPSTGPSCPQKVYLCQVALCGKFYHLSCVSKLIGGEARERGFTCPPHVCHECHQSEREEEKLWLYECRRCPRAWHRKCADKRIKFKDEEGQRRAWKVGKNRFLYCMRHKIVPDLGTPERNHLKYPSETTSVQHGEIRNLTPKNVPSTNKVINEKEITMHAEGPKWTKADITDPVMKIMKDMVRYLTPAKVASELEIPSIFASTPSGKCPVNKIHSLLRAYRKACEHHRAGRYEEARRILPPRVFQSSKESLRAYLSPFVQGAKYTSYGRYFTCENKLQAIVDRLCWYVSSGDTRWWISVVEQIRFHS